MVGCLQALGIGVTIEGDDAVVDGTGGRDRRRATSTLDAGLAGTTSRFVTALAALGDRPGHRRRRAAATRAARWGRCTTPSPRSASPSSRGETAGGLPVTITGPLTQGGTLAHRAATSPAST